MTRGRRVEMATGQASRRARSRLPYSAQGTLKARLAAQLAAFGRLGAPHDNRAAQQRSTPLLRAGGKQQNQRPGLGILRSPRSPIGTESRTFPDLSVGISRVQPESALARRPQRAQHATATRSSSTDREGFTTQASPKEEPDSAFGKIVEVSSARPQDYGQRGYSCGPEFLLPMKCHCPLLVIAYCFEGRRLDKRLARRGGNRYGIAQHRPCVRMAPRRHQTVRADGVPGSLGVRRRVEDSRLVDDAHTKFGDEVR